VLISRGAPVNTRFSYGSSPLLATSQPEIIQALVNRGADVNAADDDGITALIGAVSRLDGKTTEFLLDKGADTEAQGHYVGTPLMCAIIYNPHFNPTLSLLLAHGANVNVRGGWGSTALITAATARNLPATKFLLSNGADVNAQDKSGRTALMLVSYDWLPKGSIQWKTNRSTIQTLLRRYGANPNLKDKRGKTAADYEAEEAPGRPAS
jgi:ankyrin repeat protein